MFEQNGFLFCFVLRVCDRNFVVFVFVFVFVFVVAVVVVASPLAGEGRVRGLAKSIIQKQLNDKTTATIALREYPSSACGIFSRKGGSNASRFALREFVFYCLVFVVVASPLAGEGRVRGLAKSIIQKQLNDRTTATFAL
ncbi:MAG: hypothetical protein LBT79_01900, partial [Elusimicrobiota bacterium]|nr:hypothetical protein [Elusimicrobiota bacterium]